MSGNKIKTIYTLRLMQKSFKSVKRNRLHQKYARASIRFKYIVFIIIVEIFL